MTAYFLFSATACVADTSGASRTVLESIINSPVVAFVAGFFTAVFAEPIRRFVFRPRLSLEFGSGGDFRTRTPARGPDGSTGEQNVIRVKVTNRSRRTAKSCRPYLTDIEEIDAAGKARRTVYSDSLPLHWSARGLTDYSPVDLPHGVAQYVDVLMTQRANDSFQPCVEFTPLRYGQLLRQPATLRISVRLSGDGTTSPRIQIRFAWKGRWDDFEAEELS